MTTAAAAYPVTSIPGPRRNSRFGSGSVPHGCRSFETSFLSLQAAKLITAFSFATEALTLAWASVRECTVTSPCA
jgi:hypothetical protein